MMPAARMDERIPVAVHHQGAATRDDALRGLWREVVERGWLSTAPPAIRVQVGRRWRSPLVADTARSLAERLAELFPAARIEVRDGTGPTTPEPAVTVHAIAAGEVRVPDSWFAPSVLVTVTGVGPDPASGLSAVLEAQAEPLRDLGNAMPLPRLVYEAHRLFASDLVIACVHGAHADPSSPAHWFAAASDVAVELALIRASGGDPLRMPLVRALAAHEILPGLDPSDPECRLHGHLAPRWMVQLNAARAGLSQSRQALAQDVTSVRRNLHRIPLAIQRRLAMWRRSDE